MRLRREHGLTLLEVAVMLAVLAILATAITPVVLQRIVDARVEATRTEVQSLYEAMVGRAEQSGTYGFVGDIGRLPRTLEELVKAGSLPLQTTQTVRSVGVGWNGPYINAGLSSDDYLIDGFGRPYAPLKNGQVRSAGPDATFDTEDDIVYPPNPPVIVGRVAVVLKKKNDDGSVAVDPPGYSVLLHYANQGRPAALVAASAPFLFENVPMGLHAIQVIRNGIVVAQDTIASLGGGQTKLVELWVLAVGHPIGADPGDNPGGGRGGDSGRGNPGSGRGRGAF